jgi:phospho-N-acetylmuramoyl-pentapeptide-transferase
MFLWFLDCLGDTWPGDLSAMEKITLRGSLSAITAFLLALLLGPRMIRWLGLRFREPNRSDSAQLQRLHQTKHATPTMGGLFLIAGLVVGTVAFGDLTSGYLHTALLLAVGLCAIGVVDDLAKLGGQGTGLSALAKLSAQTAVATIAALLVYRQHADVPGGLDLLLPMGLGPISLGLGFVPLAVLVVVGSSNAVNLTDGLDGLAGGCLLCAVAAMAVVAYSCGHAELADYLHLTRIPGAGEMTVLAGGMIGGLLGFLWFNCHPAQVFMGDTGSLPLGGLLGLLAVVTRQELLLVVIGGIFVVEATSVILQVGYFKCRRKRIFRCAPLHHHFQLSGWPETRVVTRFWIASALCAIIGLAALKLQIHDTVRTPSHRVAAERFDGQRRLKAETRITAVGQDFILSEQVANLSYDTALNTPPSPRP